MISLLTGCVWLLAVFSAHAAPSPAPNNTVAVVGPESNAVTGQLEAELALMGFEVALASAPPNLTPEVLRGLARELDVAAAIVVQVHEASLDLWVIDRVTGKTTIRVVRVDDPASPDAARVGAVRAIDLLRASLRELEAEPEPPEAEVPPSPAVTAAARPKRSKWQLAFGPAVAGGSGGVGASAHVLVAVDFMPHRVFGVGLRGVAPIAGRRVVAPEGTAQLAIGWFTVGPRFALTAPERRVHVAVGASVGPGFIGMTGAANAPFVGRRDLVPTAIVEADAALAIKVHARLRVWLDAALDVAIPRVGVRFGGRRVATWGTPVAIGAAGLAVAL